MPHTSFDRHILLIMDTESLLSEHPQPSLSADAPSFVEARCLFIQGARPPYWQGQEKQPFCLTAHAGDSVFFRCAPVALRGEDILFLQEIHSKTNSVITSPQATVRPGARIARPHFDDPLCLESQTLDDYYLTARLSGTGRWQAEIRFALLNSACAVKGYFAMPITLDFQP